MASQQTTRHMHAMTEMARASAPPAASRADFRAYLVAYRVPLCGLLIAAGLFRALALGIGPRLALGDPWTSCGLGLILAGLLIRSWAAGTLRKVRGLATTGPYQWCRHPLYLGSLLLAAGFGLLFADLPTAALLLGPALLLHGLALQMEEQWLAARFGAGWTMYARATPRLLPWRVPRPLRNSWSAAQWRQNEEHNAIAGTLLGLVGLVLWRLFV